ncbi:MAG: DUF2163 domain-containing protein [Sphingopyxis sp.]|nr:DUF2163 domain-containing protein [Sphingopyxis sp.]
MSGAAWLSAPVVPLAWCWRIERRDGVTIGLTTHDRPLRIDTLEYRPSPGIKPSAIHQRFGLAGDVMEVEGGFTADAITEAALVAGRWNGARVTIMVADWEDADARHIVIGHAVLGDVSSDGTGFTASLSTRDPALSRAIVPETAPECRAELGDGACRVAMAARRHRARIVSVNGTAVTLDVVLADGVGDYGTLCWLTGAGRGLRAAIVEQVGAIVVVGLTPGVRPAAGDHVLLIEGCDKRADTCRTRFGNIANFRGEPHLPGIDLITRFPGG